MKGEFFIKKTEERNCGFAAEDTTLAVLLWVDYAGWERARTVWPNNVLALDVDQIFPSRLLSQQQPSWSAGTKGNTCFSIGDNKNISMSEEPRNG